jgi:hypothetical protein
MSTKNAMQAVLAVLGFLFFDASVQAARPLGVVTNVREETSCPTSLGGVAVTWLPTDVCYHAVVSCPEMVDIGVTIAIAVPAGYSSTNLMKGLVIVPDGADGTQLDSPAFPYHQNGYEDVDVIWDSPWQGVGAVEPDLTRGNADTYRIGGSLWSKSGSVKAAACRPATLFHWIYVNYYVGESAHFTSTAGMCAKGSSGGAAQIANALTFYGAGNYLDKVELGPGPQWSDVDIGCSASATTIKVCDSATEAGKLGCNPIAGSWNDIGQYFGFTASMKKWTGYPDCNSTHQTKAEEIAWGQMSLNDGPYLATKDASYTYPYAAITAWQTDNDSDYNNMSEGQGWQWYKNFKSASQVAGGCDNMPSGGAYYGPDGACFSVNRAYGNNKSQENISFSYVCLDGDCPVCTGIGTFTTCTCGDAPCPSQFDCATAEGKNPLTTSKWCYEVARTLDFTDPKNGCARRH